MFHLIFFACALFFATIGFVAAVYVSATWLALFWMLLFGSLVGAYIGFTFYSLRAQYRLRTAENSLQEYTQKNNQLKEKIRQSKPNGEYADKSQACSHSS